MPVEKRFKALASSELIPYLTLSPEGIVTSFNAACQSLSGYSDSEVVGKPLWKVLAPKRARAEARRKAGAPLERGDSRRCDEVWHTKTGRERSIAWVELGSGSGVERIGFDLTPMQEHEQALQEERDRLLRFLDHVPGIAFAKDAKRRITYLSAGFERNFGYPPGEAIGRRDEDFLPRAVAKRTRAIENHLLERGGSHLSVEWDEANVDSRRWMIHRFAVDDGTSRSLGGLSLDITNALQIDDRFRATAEASSDAICILSARRDARGKVVGFSIEYANINAERLMGIPPENRTEAGLLSRLDETESARVRSSLIKVMETGNELVTNTRIAGGQETHFLQLRVTRAGDNLTLEIRDITNESTAKEAEARYIADLQELASKDALTGLHNRLHFETTLADAIRAARAGGQDLSLIFADIDHFKRINDSLGHPGGDKVLNAVARVLKASVRSFDTLARYGGEEFAIIMRGTASKPAAEAAERLRIAISKTFDQHVTASFGVASLGFACESDEELVASADRALYAAKRAGRNRVEVAD